MYFSTLKSGNVLVGMFFVSFFDKNSKYLFFYVLKYISEYFFYIYDYYMFIIDRTYIRVEKIIEFVSYISISEDIYMGVVNIYVENISDMCFLEGGVIIL